MEGERGDFFAVCERASVRNAPYVSERLNGGGEGRR